MLSQVGLDRSAQARRHSCNSCRTCALLFKQVKKNVVGLKPMRQRQSCHGPCIAMISAQKGTCIPNNPLPAEYKSTVRAWDLRVTAAAPPTDQAACQGAEEWGRPGWLTGSEGATAWPERKLSSNFRMTEKSSAGRTNVSSSADPPLYFCPAPASPDEITCLNQPS